MEKNRWNYDDGRGNVAVLITLLLSVLVIIYGPMIIIWALNTLFPVLNIPITFKTWLATYIVIITSIVSVTFNSRPVVKNTKD
jgi:hypothetical protein